MPHQNKRPGTPGRESGPEKVAQHQIPIYCSPEKQAELAGLEPGKEPETTSEVVARLAALSALEYDRVRSAEAEALGVRVPVLDKEVAKAQRQAQENKGPLSEAQPWPGPVDAAELLDELRATVERFIVSSPEVATATALWCAFTWVIDHIQIAPLAVITAPEKRCGKSQLLNLIGRLCRRPMVASSISPAATFRVIEALEPTLLLDEADAFFKENEELRGVINSGHTRQSAYTIRCVGDNHEPRQFSTWGAKAVSGIGALADTLMDRAVILELRRKLPHERVERLRHAEPGLFEALSSKLARFAEDYGAAVGSIRPNLPEALNDRAQDNWEPLLAIADVAGGHWPALAREAALAMNGDAQDAKTIGEELLADIRSVFDRRKVDRISMHSLLEALCEDAEAPWATWTKGKPMTIRQLSKRLKDYGVEAKTMRLDGGTAKAFARSDFEDAWSRYTHSSSPPFPPVTQSQVNDYSKLGVTESVNVTVTENAPVTPNMLKIKDCYRVTERSGGMGEGQCVTGERRFTL